MESKQARGSESEIISTGVAANAERNPIKPGKYSAKRIYAGELAQITEIAFDANVELSEHMARTPIIVQVIDGNVDFTVDGQKHQLAVGGSIFVPANVMHAVYAENPARITVTFLSA